MKNRDVFALCTTAGQFDSSRAIAVPRETMSPLTDKSSAPQGHLKTSSTGRAFFPGTAAAERSGRLCPRGKLFTRTQSR